ncbi:hypothetical protein QFZ30_000102 [Arthrobacter pascens]|uniref:hypothetical protein n=1 Tax=Arthrobacter pascens TaxID=1677 RepID=UPI002791DE0D|nr:hypothetical protein [Arthrobacter pascens]MDQ0676720.1 hypothetical protein [Arthrobacter pascens]
MLIQEGARGLAVAGFNEVQKVISAVCARSGTTPVWAVVGRSDLDEEAAKQLGLATVMALQDLTKQDTSQDPALAASGLQQAGRTILQAPQGTGARC